MSNRNFAVIGGDMRSISLANALYSENNAVTVYGINDSNALKAPRTSDLEEAVYNANILILPLPMLNNEGYIHMPLSTCKNDLTSLLRLMNKNQILLGGKIPDAAKQLIKIHGVYAVDYLKREELTVTNAMITAEGAIEMLLSLYNKTLCFSKILILGYGRIGKFLTRILCGFGADLTIAGRRADTKAWVESSGFKYANIEDNELYRKDIDIIINTVPYLILNESRLNALSENCLILDLASFPGGTDFAHAKSIGLTAIHALSLPGKSAPITAGQAIKDTILNICQDLGV